MEASLASVVDELSRLRDQLAKEVAKRKRAEAAVLESERESRLIVDRIPGLVATLTPAGEVEGVNNQVIEYCGRTLEELKRWGTSDTVHPEDLRRVTEVLTQSMASGDPYEIEERIRRFDGVYRWFQVRGLPLRDSNGRIVRWYVLLTDIDARKRADSQLAGEKRLLEMVASSCPLSEVLTALCNFVEVTSADCHCGVYLIDWSGPRFRNGAVPSLPASFNDSTDGLPVRPEIGPCGQAALLKQQVIVADLETDPLWQESAIRPLALAHGIRSHWSTPIYARDGRVLGTFAIFHREPASPTQIQQDLIAQVTHIASIAIERALSEAALKRSEAFLAEAQHLSRVGSFAWRVATNEITWSEQLYRMFEFDPQVTVTLDLIRTRVHPEDLTLLHEMIDRARSAASDFEYEHRLLMPDGSVKHLHLIAHGTKNESGEVEYIGATQDVTQRRLAEEALDKARSELAHVARVMSLGALTASIAHEVNQPLSGIITNASTCLRMLNADPPNVEGARETAKRTIRDGNRASDVVTRLRALFSKKELTLESLDLNEAAREVIALSSSELQRNRVVLQSELADDLPSIIGDRVQLQQVILNLLRNASDAMVAVDDRPRQLVVRTARDAGDRVRLTVKDAGEGFDSHTVDKFFEAFYTTKPSGMGIGLSVSRSIIESHHGRIWAEPNDGPGATFAFAIPCAVESSIDTETLRRRIRSTS